MLKKSELREEQIINCLRDEYGLSVEKISYLPIGADPNASVYRVETKDETSYFLKVKKGDFNEASVVVPNFLRERFNSHVARIFSMRRELAIYTMLSLDTVVCS